MPITAIAMDNDAQLVMRIPLEMQDRLREYAARLSREYGLPVSMAAGARRLLNEGLERAGLEAPAEDAKKKAPAKKRGRR